MGPEATADLYLRIIKIFQKQGAVKDCDFPEMVIINLPIPDVVGNLSEENKVKEMLIEGVKKLENAGANFIVIPCNTVNYFLPEMRKEVSIPIINILQETANEVKKQGFRKVGIIGTEMTINKAIYNDVLNEVELVLPTKEDQKETTKIIMNVLAGKKTKEDKTFLRKIISELKLQGSESIILGCTELPLLIRKSKDTLNTIEILAQAVVRESIGRKLYKQNKSTEV
ncbi:amino acid racemase [Candidatus Woesearchaeota archaeon]|nr:amino acid racemase [Candidatus Woesearchaeota archaeon]